MPYSFLSAALIYWLFVIYGSLVPFNYQPIPVETALSRFQNIPFLDLGIEARADWVANILLYIPLAFFASGACRRIHNHIVRTFVKSGAVAFCLATALLVEFAQLYFPTRTVSSNDLIAETLGTGLGFLGWQFFGRHYYQLSKQIVQGNWLSARAAMIFFLAGYLVLNLFPFDFVTSSAELEQKLESGSVGWLFAPEISQDSFRSCMKLLAEILALTPLGALMYWLPNIRFPLVFALLTGLFLGILIESLQLFIFSNVAQGISVLTRMAGVGLGVLMAQALSLQRLADWRRFFRPLALLAGIPYLLLIMASNGWFSGPWLSAETAAAKLAVTQFMPFYYFYYTTETLAMMSLLGNFAAYLPVGVLFWLFFSNSPRHRQPPGLLVGLSAALLAATIEAGKLFLPEKHADPTDLLIAFTAAALGYGVLRQLRRLENASIPRHSPTSALSEQQPALAEPHRHRYQTSKIALWLSLPLAAVIVALVFAYPKFPLALGLGLAVYACWLWRSPDSWLVVLPALLPVLDFAPYTGRFFFDEFDLLVLTTLAVGYCRRAIPDNQDRPRLFSAGTRMLLTWFGICYLISLALGLLPLPAIDANAFNNYYSHYNALRVGKGFFWACLLLPLLRQNLAQNQHGRQLLAFGLLTGLALMSGFAIVERWVFPGLTDFSFDYRINALFSSMHTGGGHIESYLSLTMPFIAVLLFNPKPFWAKASLAVALSAASLYALLMTFSRGGYIGLTVGLLVLILAMLASYRRRLSSSWQPYLLGLLLLALIPALAIPVLQGELIKQRFEVAERDKNIRATHWQDAVAMMDDSLATLLFGMGLGSYPRTFFWLNDEQARPASYLIENDNGDNFLRLRSGDALYFGQYLDIKQHTRYRLSMKLRSAETGMELLVEICEKSLQYSFRCQSLANKTPGPVWRTLEQTVDSGELAAKSPAIANGWLSRPVQLALQNNNGSGKIIDVDAIELRDSAGNNLIKNGDFNQGSDYWFFATEKHHPWHIFNFWVDLLFNTGWLGLISFVLLLLTALFRLCAGLTGNPFAAVQLASFSAFLVVGFVDSPFDAPRLSLLFWLLLFIALSQNSNKPQAPNRQGLRPRPASQGAIMPLAR